METVKEAVEIVQEREDGSWPHASHSREEETWPEPEFILKVETTEFAGRSDVGYDRKEGLG